MCEKLNPIDELNNLKWATMSDKETDEAKLERLKAMRRLILAEGYPLPLKINTDIYWLERQIAAARAEAEAAKPKRTLGGVVAVDLYFRWKLDPGGSDEFFTSAVRDAINAAFAEGAKRQREADVKWARSNNFTYTQAWELEGKPLVTPEMR